MENICPKCGAQRQIALTNPPEAGGSTVRVPSNFCAACDTEAREHTNPFWTPWWTNREGHRVDIKGTRLDD